MIAEKYLITQNAGASCSILKKTVRLLNFYEFQMVETV